MRVRRTRGAGSRGRGLARGRTGSRFFLTGGGSRPGDPQDTEEGLEPPCLADAPGSRSHGGARAPGGTAGQRGVTGRTRSQPEPKGGRVTGSASFGQSDIARSARPLMKSDGFTPGFAGITLPFMT